MKPESDNPATAVVERGKKYRWVVIVAAVIVGAIAGGAKLTPVTVVFLLVLGGIFVLVNAGGERLFQWTFGARIERRVSQGSAHPERIMRGLVTVSAVMVVTLVLTLAGGPAWVRLAAYLLASIIISFSIWSAGRSTRG